MNDWVDVTFAKSELGAEHKIPIRHQCDVLRKLCGQLETFKLQYSGSRHYFFVFQGRIFRRLAQLALEHVRRRLSRHIFLHVFDVLSRQFEEVKFAQIFIEG
jgi:hypothetical protein